MDHDRSSALRHTHAGRGHPEFPSTRWELFADVAREGRQSAAALNEVAERYYAAVHAFITAVARPPSDPDDLTQRFFETVVLSGRLLARVDRNKGNFRPYLKQAIRNFVIDEYRRHGKLPNAEVRPDGLDESWDRLVADSSPRPDEELLRAWARSLVAMAVGRLEAHCQARDQTQHYELFVRRYLTDPDRPTSWREVGQAFGLDEKTARSRAETASRSFRTLLRELIASDIGCDGDVDRELQAVISIL